jgi:hypothetical protein
MKAEPLQNVTAVTKHQPRLASFISTTYYEIMRLKKL